jgi:hypothetical protein
MAGSDWGDVRGGAGVWNAATAKTVVKIKKTVRRGGHATRGPSCRPSRRRIRVIS